MHELLACNSFTEVDYGVYLIYYGFFLRNITKMYGNDSLNAEVILFTKASAGIGATSAAVLAKKFPGIKLVLSASHCF